MKTLTIKELISGVKIFCASMMVLAFSACGEPTYIDTADSKSYTSMGLDYHDIESVAQKSVASLLESDYVQKIKSPKVLVISDIINDTMQTIDVEQLSRKVARDMRNSGKFKLSLALAGSGAQQDKMVNRVRKTTRDNDEYDQYSVIEKGQLKGAQLSLSGKIYQKNVRVKGSKQRTDYFFLLTLLDLATGEVIWDEEVNIIKLGSNKSVSW
ncbi:penicillin-binding protein activator LpoB [Helicobacter sp. 23-1048]